MIEANRILISDSWPYNDQAIFLNLLQNTGNSIDREDRTGPAWTKNQWHTIDLSDILPKDCVAVFLSGLLLISKSDDQSTILSIQFRPTGSGVDTTSRIDYTAHSKAHGVRSPLSMWVKLNNTQKFDFRYKVENIGTSNVGINLRVNAAACNFVEINPSDRSVNSNEINSIVINNV